MDARRAKQVTYGALYLILVLGILSGVYRVFFYAAPSCFDGRQDGGETGVDCGGPCAKACIPANLSTISALGGVQIIDPRPADSSLPKRYTLLVQVANANPGFAASDFSYEFDLYGGASETFIGSVPGQSFLYGGEVKYLLVPNVEIPAPVDQAKFTITTSTWVPDAEFGFTPQFTLQNLGSVAVSSGTVSVNGEIRNGDVATFTGVLIVGIFYDSMNNVVGASQTIVDRISPNETRQFTVSYPFASNIDPSRTKFFAYAARS